MTTTSQVEGHAGRLSLVATPIGNLGDLSPRARETLEQADIVACEDTRHTGLLFSRLGFKKKLLSVHDRNEASRVAEILEGLRAGQHIALVSDAGHPGLSDPGQRLVHAVAEAGLAMETVPGPCAIPAALSASGFPFERFFFGGFLTTKKGRRTRELQEACDREDTTVFFESPHRIAGTLEILAGLAPDRPTCVARELTKKFETFHRGTATELANEFSEGKTKGEIVLLIAGSKPPKWFHRKAEVDRTEQGR